MELKHLRTFQAVVDQGGYLNAARFLGYTQSTVTVQIQQLEAELGVPLFQRVGRRMVLTAVGEQALSQARTLLREADRLSAIGQEGRALTGTLRVDMAESLLCYRMQPVIRAFRTQAPRVRLIIRGRNCLQIAENVRSGSCDLGLGYDMDWEQDALETEQLGVCSVVLLAAPGFAQGDFITPHQRKAASLITDEPDSIFRRQLEGYLRQRDILLDETIELWSIETIRRCVMSGLGFTFLPRFVAEEDLAAGRLVELEAPISGIQNPVLCAWHKNRWITPAMALFRQLLTEAFAAAPVAPGKPV